MWVVGYRNAFYACEDTNAAIENYYGTLKGGVRIWKEYNGSLASGWDH